MPGFIQPSLPGAWKVATTGHLRQRERRDADRRRHRLVDVEDVEALALERALDPRRIVAG